MRAQGSVLTNKYAEGYPGRRYYAGCQHVDEVETVALECAKRLFDCGYVNVQPHSAAQANTAVFLALLRGALRSCRGEQTARPKNITGKAAEIALEHAGITCNRNSIPFDSEKPAVTSGIRLGTAAATTRGFGWLKAADDEAIHVLGAIDDAERNRIANPTAWLLLLLTSPHAL